MIHRRPQTGFTLLEMLIAITLLSLLAGLAYGTLHTGVRSWEAAERQADQGDALAVGWPYLHQTLESSQPTPAPQSRELLFDGGTDELVWVAQLPSHLADGGPHKLRLFVHTDNDTRQLRLSYHDIDATDLTAPDNRQAILVDRLAGLQLRYYGLGPDKQTGWFAQWQARDQLPSLVQIDIQPENAPAWPSLIARLRLSAPAHLDDQDEEGKD